MSAEYKSPSSNEFDKRYLSSASLVFEAYRGRPQIRKLHIILPTINREDHRTEQGILQKTVESAIGVNLSGYSDIAANTVLLSDQSKEKALAGENVTTLSLALETINKRIYRRERNRGQLPELPRLYYFHLGSKIVNEILLDYLGEDSPYLTARPGKGLNMYFASLVAGKEHERPEKNEVLVFWDDDHRTVTPQDMEATALPIVTDEDMKFVKTAFDSRAHYEGAEKYSGGRVNSTLGKPIIKVLKKMKLIEADPRYPLTGDIAVSKDALYEWWFGSRYGVEMVTLLQTISNFEAFKDTRLEPKNYMEVCIGKDFDKAHAEGKPKVEALEDLKSMAQQITMNLVGAVGEELKEKFDRDPDKFMDMLKEYNRQISHRLVMGGRKIAADFTLEELNESILGGVGDIVYDFFKSDSADFRGKYGVDKEIIPPINQLKEELGKEFDDLVSDLRGQRKEIHVPA
ncbi:MAG: hypothetical protein GTN38_03930 [Candidatus Aenigmarchaeota archaeon]|nr:hypothetical protein [Candidatus Aenigmarchaeota archaeon]NIP40812.1 hypothetical protein [Candidatus Aenigmarchaeota archaeon]NIQ17926.1 hypothetical protein [Candidatus Aenigmarchaeota archaeon]NIS73515.1 hypothetical protein [Candidatus Aenigmarchaeota archaeon]